MHLQSRRLALSGILCALAVLCLLLGGLIPVAVYCCPILAALILLPIREECGSRLALTAWAAVSLLGLLLIPDREITGVYLFFGWYPVAQPVLNKLRPRFLCLLCKGLLFNSTAAALTFALLFLFESDAAAAQLADTSPLFLVILLLTANLTFFVTDIVLTRATSLWRFRLRKWWFR